jgi:homoserine O-acetyltransferase
MDSHNVGRTRESIESALKSIKARTLIVGIDSDILFPLHEQRYLAETIPNARLELMSSLYGHDGFLVEFEQLSNHIRKFFKEDLVSVETKPLLK